jgi:hypothetical protein
VKKLLGIVVRKAKSLIAPVASTIAIGAFVPVIIKLVSEIKRLKEMLVDFSRKWSSRLRTIIDAELKSDLLSLANQFDRVTELAADLVGKIPLPWARSAAGVLRDSVDMNRMRQELR